MNIIHEAKSLFNKQLIELHFINCLKERGYYNRNNDYNNERLFLKCLLKKDYIDQRKYNEIICELDSLTIKTFNKELRVNFNEEVDTYDISNNNFIDYESVHIEGIEYYFNESNFKVAENVNFSDIGLWNSDIEEIEFTKEEDRMGHIGRVELIG